jgi:predicted Fe-Mo cluster-binding NifX family protein
MAERVQIVLEAQDLASGVLRGLVSRFGTLGQVVSDASDAFGRFSNLMSLASKSMTEGNVSAEELDQAYSAAGVSMARLGETIAVAIVQTIQEAIKVTDEYNSQIRDLSLVSGQGAEATSRFIQVLDDYELTAEDAMTAAKALKEKGLSPTIDTLAMLADEFKKIKDPAERMAFVQENLGKGGAKWVNVLNQEGDALREAAAAIDPWLVKTDEQIKKAEISRLALDELSDSWAAFQNRIGDAKNELVFANEASQRAYEILQEQGVRIDQNTVRTESYKKAVQQANEELLASAEASLEDTAAKEAEAEALKKLAESNAQIISGAIALTEETKNYQQSQDDILKKIQELNEKKSEYSSNEIDKIKETQDQINELNLKYEENAQAYIAAQEKKFAMMAIEKIAMEDGVEGYNEAEFAKAKAILETTDVASAAAFDQQQAQVMLTDAVANSQITVQQFGDIMKTVMADGVVSVNEVKDALDSIERNIDINLNVHTNYSTAGQAQLTQQLAGEKNYVPHASGGSFVIPSAYGNEGFRLGNGDTASAGERLTITPAGKDPNAGVIEAIDRNRIDYNELARAIISASQQGAK